MSKTILEGKKKGKQNPWWDDDGDGIGYEPGEVSGKFKRKKVKEAKEVKRWWDDDGDGIGYEPGEVSGKFKKKKKKIKEGFSNWRHDLLEQSDDEDNTKKFKETKVKNKIKTSAIGSGIQIGEEFGETGGVILEVNELDEITDIFSELNEHEISFLSDNFIENIVEEALIECIEEGYDINEVVDTLIENIDLNQDVLNEAKVTYGHDTKIKSDKLQKVKSAVKTVGKSLARGAGYVAGAAVRGAKAVGREFGSGYERGRKGSSSETTSSSRKSSAPGILSRIGSKLKRGIKGVIAKGARSLSRGARDVARKMEGGKSEKPSSVHSKSGVRDPSPRSGIGGGKKVEVAGSGQSSTEKETTPEPPKARPKATRKKSSVSSRTSRARRAQELRRKGDEVLASIRNEDLDMDSSSTTNPQVANAKRELSTLDLKRTKLLTKIAQQKKQQREEYDLSEREMTASDKSKEEKLKVKFDASSMKQNMIDQYGKERGKQVYFAKIRKMAMEDYELDEAKLSRTEKRAQSSGKKKKGSKTMHLVDLDANAMKPKKKGVEAEIEVKKSGKTVRSLNPQQFNTDKKKDDEKYDFGQFASSKVFKKTLKGNKHVRNLHRGGEASGLTARGKMDKPREVVGHIKSSGFSKKHGVKFKGVHFTGDVPGKGTDDKKMKVIKHLIKTKKPKQIKFSDDHAKNLQAPERFNKEGGKDKTKNRGSSTPKIKTYLTRDDGRPKRFGSGGGGIRDPKAVSKASSPQEKQKRRKQARMGEEFELD